MLAASRFVINRYIVREYRGSSVCLPKIAWDVILSKAKNLILGNNIQLTRHTLSY
jgi:hypothetical protein